MTPLPDAFSTGYLEGGTDRQRALFAALGTSQVLTTLEPYRPALVSTIALGIDLPNSDVDVVCSAASPVEFLEFAHRQWYAMSAYRSLLLTTGEAIVQLSVSGFLFELYCSAIPTPEQSGVRHFQQVARVLSIGGEPVREAIMQHRWQGLKTEEAVARVLKLEGDHYQAVLGLETWSETELRDRLASEKQ